MLAAPSVRLPRPAEAAALHVRPEPRDAGEATRRHGVTLGQALADPRQWCLNLAWLVLGGLAFVLTVHIVPFARDQGVPLGGALLALTAYGVGSVGGRIAAGAMSDRVGTLATMRIAYALQALALLALFWLPARETLLASLAAFGAGFAAADTMIAKAIPEVFGVRAIGATMGLLTLGWRAGAALGPAAAGFLYDATGSYAAPFGAAPLVVLLRLGALLSRDLQPGGCAFRPLAPMILAT
jgi:predicted MFS family arabinose efflux permease